MTKIQKIIESSREIPKSLLTFDKYTFAASLGLEDIRFLNINDTLQSDTGINPYISANGEVLVFPNYLFGELVSVFVKPLRNKKSFLKLGNFDIPMYLSNIQDIKYGDFLYLVEGIADYISIKLLCGPNINVIPMMSSSLSDKQLKLVSSLTNNIVIISDNDEAGRISYFKMRKELVKYGVTLKQIKPPKEYKDAGDVLDIVKSYKEGNLENKSEIEYLKSYYRTSIEVIEEQKL